MWLEKQQKIALSVWAPAAHAGDVNKVSGSQHVTLARPSPGPLGTLEVMQW